VLSGVSVDELPPWSSGDSVPSGVSVGSAVSVASGVPPGSVADGDGDTLGPGLVGRVGVELGKGDGLGVSVTIG
jgi:hypothetical protein